LIDISKYAEVQRRMPPMNSDIAEWLRKHGTPVPPMRGDIHFASVSALNYAAEWLRPLRPDTALTTFHGRRGSEPATFFFEGQTAWMDSSASCERAVLNTRNGGLVVLRSIDGPVAQTMSCLEKRLTGPAPGGVLVELPALHLSVATDLRSRLQSLGVIALFRTSADPFPSLMPDEALDSVLQSADLTLDAYGITVKASTVTDIALSAHGHIVHRFRFDHPFALRVLDPEGHTVALAAVFDV
jgi:hypothetical protein